MNIKLPLSILIAAMMLITASRSFAIREFDQANHPSMMFVDYETRLNALPLQGSVRQKPWSDTYWPDHKGGAAQRWQQGEVGPYSYRLYSAEEILTLPNATLQALSPAEKYDIIHGDYNYPTVQAEIQRAQPNSQRWAGLCHAVAAATTTFKEPETLYYMAPMIDGSEREVTIYSSDVKAMLALAVHYQMDAQSQTLGSRCESGTISNSGACWDTNPGSFFLAVANLVGTNRQTLIMDVDANHEVWNSAIVSYSARITNDQQISSRAAPGTILQKRVALTVEHTVGASPRKNQVGGRYKTQVFEFTLELNRHGQIIGGEWISQVRPDFLWLPNMPSQFAEPFATIEEMVQRF